MPACGKRAEDEKPRMTPMTRMKATTDGGEPQNTRHTEERERRTANGDKPRMTPMTRMKATADGG